MARLDQKIRELFREQGQNVSVRQIQKALLSQKIRVQGIARKPGEQVADLQWQDLDLTHFLDRFAQVLQPDLELAKSIPILHEDQELLVLSKPSGLPTTPHGDREGPSLVSAAITICPAILQAGPFPEGGLLHRLDHGTSGVVMFAKTEGVRVFFREEFRKHTIRKTYLAVVCAQKGPLPTRFWVEQSIVQRGNHVRCVPPGSPLRGALEARTEGEVLGPVAPDQLLVRCTTWTGRRHQIRAHLAWLGAPILGDPLYGEPLTELTRQTRLALHAERVELPDGRWFEAALERDDPIAQGLQKLSGRV